MRFSDIIEWIKVLPDQVEAGITDLAAKIGPLVAPLPTAFAVGTSVVKHLGWPDWVGVSAAIAVECLGLDSVNTALLLREHNATKRKNDPLAPFTLAAALAGVYLVVAIALAVIQDVVPELVIYSPAIFPLLSLTGVTVLGLRADHRRRMETIAQEKAVRRAARESKKMSKVVQEPVQSANLDTLNRSRRKRKAVILDEMVDLYRATPDIGASPGYG